MGKISNNAIIIIIIIIIIITIDGSGVTSQFVPLSNQAKATLVQDGGGLDIGSGGAMGAVRAGPRFGV